MTNLDQSDELDRVAAKARLADAAPSLLASCKEMLAFFSDRRTRIVYPYGRELVDILINARAAIAKAEERAS